MALLCLRAWRAASSLATRALRGAIEFNCLRDALRGLFQFEDHFNVNATALADLLLASTTTASEHVAECAAEHITEGIEYVFYV